jgi:hypothetical protein
VSNAPRCLAPMQERPNGEINPVCWRPQHADKRHRSKQATRAAIARAAKQHEKLMARRREWTGQLSATMIARTGADTTYAAPVVIGEVIADTLSKSGAGICSGSTDDPCPYAPSLDVLIR